MHLRDGHVPVSHAPLQLGAGKPHPVGALQGLQVLRAWTLRRAGQPWRWHSSDDTSLVRFEERRLADGVFGLRRRGAAPQPEDSGAGMHEPPLTPSTRVRRRTRPLRDPLLRLRPQRRDQAAETRSVRRASINRQYAHLPLRAQKSSERLDPEARREPGYAAGGAAGSRSGPGSGPCSASKARLTSAKAVSARSSVARSWVAITLVRSSAPPGGTAGCRATLT